MNNNKLVTAEQRTLEKLLHELGQDPSRKLPSKCNNISYMRHVHSV